MSFAQADWSSQKHQGLKNQLLGFWAEDVWDLQNCPLKPAKTTLKDRRFLKFQCASEFVNTELKYVIWQKLKRQEWTIGPALLARFNLLMRWAKREIPPLAQTFLTKELHEWEMSFCSFLLDAGFNLKKTGKYLNGSQVVTEYAYANDSITFLRAIYRELLQIYDQRYEYEKEIWDLRLLNIKPSRTDHHNTVNFTKIHQPWLNQLAKKFTRYRLTHNSLSDCRNKLKAINSFSDFLEGQYPGIVPANLTRQVVIDYLTFLAQKNLLAITKTQRISGIQVLFETAVKQEWITLPRFPIIYREDYPPKDKKLPRFIPNQIIQQILEHLPKLEVIWQRAFLIAFETGARVGELLTLPCDCLIQDGEGSWWVRFFQSKLRKEHVQPISNQTAIFIQAQQKDVTSRLGPSASLLFPTPKGKSYTAQVFRNTINEFIVQNEIRDEMGKLWRFQPHQLRHSVGMNMINNGVPLHIIQKFLGHESPDMTMRYAHIQDQTLKTEFQKFKNRLVDITGSTVSVQSIVQELGEGQDLASLDQEWLKRNVLTQALPNGLCALPVIKGTCPFGANKCLTCTHFKTDPRYLNQHKDHLERTTKLVAWAKEQSESRRAQEILKENLPIKENLERIITSLEEKTHDPSA